MHTGVDACTLVCERERDRAQEICSSEKDTMSETRHFCGDIGFFCREMRLFCGDLWFAEIWDVLVEIVSSHRSLFTFVSFGALYGSLIEI